MHRRATVAPTRGLMPKAKLHIEIDFHEAHAPATLRALRPVLYGELFARLPGCNPALTRLRVGPAGLTATRIALRRAPVPLRRHVEEIIRQNILTCVETAMAKVKRQEALAQERRRRAAEGYAFEVSHRMDALAYGPVYFRTREEAIERCDTILSEYRLTIPDDYFERQAHVLTLTVEATALKNGTWTTIFTRDATYGIDFLDGKREKLRGGR